MFRSEGEKLEGEKKKEEIQRKHLDQLKMPEMNQQHGLY